MCTCHDEFDILAADIPVEDDTRTSGALVGVLTITTHDKAGSRDARWQWILIKVYRLSVITMISCIGSDFSGTGTVSRPVNGLEFFFRELRDIFDIIRVMFDICFFVFQKPSTATTPGEQVAAAAATLRLIIIISPIKSEEIIILEIIDSPLATKLRFTSSHKNDIN
jgi:hypothetical protein